MAQRAGSINAGLTRHGFQIPLLHLVINKETMSPFASVLISSCLF
jgi:hypothetical protein